VIVINFICLSYHDIDMKYQSSLTKTNLGELMENKVRSSLPNKFFQYIRVKNQILITCLKDSSLLSLRSTYYWKKNNKYVALAKKPSHLI